MPDFLQSQFGYVDPKYESGKSGAFAGTLEVGAHEALQMLSAFGWGVFNRGGNTYLRDAMGESYMAEERYRQEAMEDLPVSRQAQLNQPLGLDNLSFATFGAHLLKNVPAIGAAIGASAAGGFGGGAAAGAALTGGDTLSSMVEYFSTATDNDIRMNPAFADQIEAGMTPEQIRQGAIDTTVGNWDLIGSSAGALLGAAGAETVLGRMLGGKGKINLGIGRVPAAGAGFAAEGFSEAVEEAIPAYAQNVASEETGGAIPEVSVPESAMAGFILGAPTGGVAGAIGGGKKNSQVTTLQPGQPNPAANAALTGQTGQQTQPPAGTTGAVPPVPPAGTAPLTGAVPPVPPAPPSTTQTAPPAGATQPAGTPPQPPSNTPQNVQGTVPGSNVAPPPSPGPVPEPPAPPSPLAPDVEQALTGTPIEATPIEDATPTEQAIPEQAQPDTKPRQAEPLIETNENPEQPIEAVEPTVIEDAPVPAPTLEATPEVTTAEAIPEAPVTEPTPIEQGGPENVVQGPEGTPVAPEPQIEPTVILEAPASISTATEQAVEETPPIVEEVTPEVTAPSLAPVEEPVPMETGPAFSPSTGGQVLEVAPTEEVKAETQRYNKRQSNKAGEQVRQGKRAEAKTPAELIRTMKISEEEKTKRAETDPAAAKQILQDTGSLTADDYDDLPTLATRVATVLKRAAEAGIKMPTRVTRSVPDEIVWLKNMEIAMRRGKEGVERLRAGEFAARTGDFSVFRSDHGATSAGRSGGVGSSQSAQDKAELERYRREQAEEAKADEAGEVIPEGTEEEQEAAAAAAEEAGIASGEEVEAVEPEFDTAEEVDEEEDIAATSRPDEDAVEEEGTQKPTMGGERPAVVTEAKEGVHYTVGKATKPVQAVKKGQRQKMEGVARPTGKVSLGPRKQAAPTEAEVKQETKQVDDNVKAVTPEVTTPDVPRRTAKLLGVGKPADIQARSDAAKNTLGAVEFNDGNWVVPVDEITVGQEIDARRGDSQKGRKGAARSAIVNHIFDLAKRAFPNMKVYILADEDVDMSKGDYDIYDDGKVTAGYYHRDRGDGKGEYIVLSIGTWLDTIEGGQTLAHELLHAFTLEGIISNDTLANKFQDLLDEMKATRPGQDIYGLTNIFEFFAELSNPEFVRMLKEMPVSRETAKYFGLETWRKATGWNAFIALVRKIVGRIVSNQSDFSMYDVLLSSTERFSHAHDKVAAIQYHRAAARTAADADFDSIEAEFAKARKEVRSMRRANPPDTARRIKQYFSPTPPTTASALNSTVSTSAVMSAAQNAVQQGSNLLGSISTGLLGARDTADIMRGNEDKFGPGQLREATDALASRYVEAQKLKGEDAKLLMEEAKVLDQYKATMVGTGANAVSAQDAYVDLLEDMDNWKVDPRKTLKDHTWLGQNAVKGILPKRHYPRIVKAYNDLQAAAPGLATFVGKKTDYYSAKIKEAIDAMLAEAVIDADLNHNKQTPTLTYGQALAMGHRIMNNKATTHDESVIGKDAIKRIHKTPEFKVKGGPYHPSMRWGDWNISAKVDVADPTVGTWQKPPVPNTAQPGGYTVDFSGPTAQKDATKFGYETPSGTMRKEYSEVKRIWTDKNGNEYDAQGHKFGPKDIQQGAEERWRVWINDEHVAFRENQSEAQQITEDLKKDPYYKTVNEVRRRPAEPEPRAAMAGSHQLQAIHESFKKRFGANSNQGVAGMVNLILMEAAHRAAPGSSLSKRNMQKRHVAGQSRDTLRVMHAYSTQMNNFIAAVRSQRRIHDAFDALEKSVKNNYTKNQPKAQAVLDEMNKRRNNMQGLHERGGTMGPLINTATSLQVLDKLASPGYSIANLTQLPMVGVPVLAEKFGLFPAVRAIGKAMKDVGFAQVLGKGIKDTANQITKRLESATNFHEFISSGPNITPEVKTMFDALRDVGVLDPDAGFEALSVTIKGTGTKALHKVETVFRAFPRAVEASMRYSLAKATYELGIAKGWSVEKATREARDTVEKSMFNYNPSNSARFFSNPIGQIGFQFMKFGFNMYQLMGSQLVRIFKQSSSKEERIEAIRGFTLLLGAHFLVAGATGLPTEPIRVPLFLLNTLGLIDFTMDDLETEFREMMVDVTGSETFGEVLARGLPRLLNIDFSQRLGLSSLAFQRPLGTIEDEQDTMAYMFKYFGGPTAQMASDWFAGSRYATQGEWTRAIEKWVPVKILSDAANAYRGATEGLKTKYGDVYHTYSPVEAIMETFGIGTGGAANVSEGRSYYYSSQNRMQEERREILQDYRDNPGQRGSMYRRFQEFNKKWQPNNPLNIKAAQDYVKEHTGNYKKGIKEEPSNKALLRRIEGFIP